jgi:hypothetical protein
MVGETGPSRDDAGSGLEPPIAPRVRRAFGLLERVAPAVGSRWAIELWCTPPAVEMSLRMPPGVAAGEPVEASWSGHRIAGEAWGDGPAVYLVHSLGAKAAALAVSRGMQVERLAFLAPMGDFSWYLDLFAEKHGFGRRTRTGLRRRLDRRLNTPLFDTDIAAVARRISDPPPLLVVHDPDDPDSPHTMSEEIVRAWSGARLVTTRGLGRLAHYRILRHRPAITAAVNFIGSAQAHVDEPVTGQRPAIRD